MQQWIRYCRSRSNIIVRLLEEAKSQAQPERGSCEHSRGAVPWSTHIARLLHETKLLFEPNIVVPGRGRVAGESGKGDLAFSGFQEVTRLHRMQYSLPSGL